MDWMLIAKIVLAILSLALIVGAIPALLIWKLYYSKGNRNLAKVLSDGRIEFPPRQWIFLIWPLFASYSIYRFIESVQHGRSWRSALIPIAILGFATVEELISFPGTVAVTRDGIEQVYWFRKKKYIRWGDIVEVNTGKRIRRIEITGADHTIIVHSSNLADRERLLLELKQHCGDNLPPDFPSEPANRA